MATIPDWAPPWWYPWHPWYHPSLIPAPVIEDHYRELAAAAADLAVGLAKKNEELRRAVTQAEKALRRADAALREAEGI